MIGFMWFLRRTKKDLYLIRIVHNMDPSLQHLHW